MTEQEIFNTVVRHLRKQGAPAQSGFEGTCMYRAPGGLKCAAGCLIPDEDYDPKFEGNSVFGPNVNPYFSKRFSNNQISLIRELQEIHDDRDIQNWEFDFKRLAKRWKLEVPTLDDK